MPSPMITWSKTFIPMALPASISCFVALISSWLGCGSPLGWLWTSTIEFAHCSIANLNISRGWNTLALSVPSKMVDSAIILPHFTSVASSPALPVVVTPPLVSKASTTTISFVKIPHFGHHQVGNIRGRSDFLLLGVEMRKSLAEFKRRDDFL